MGAWIIGFEQGYYKISVCTTMVLTQAGDQAHLAQGPSTRLCAPLMIKPANIVPVSGLLWAGTRVNSNQGRQFVWQCRDDIVCTRVRCVNLTTAPLCASQTQAGPWHGRYRGETARPARVEWYAWAGAEH